MIYVECKPDATLVQVLTQLPRREIVHELKGKYEVVKRISNGRNARGLVDEDPEATQPAYFGRMRLEEDFPYRGLKLLQDAGSNHVILLCPKLEDWIIRAAREVNVSLDHYNLFNDPRRLHQVINIDLRRFERLVQDLRSAPRLRCLLRLLNL